MINALYAILCLRPKPYDSIGMAVADDINLVGMLDSGMIEPERRQAFVNRVFIGENLRALLDVGHYQRDDSASLGLATLPTSSFPFHSTMPTTGVFPSAPRPRLPVL